MATARHKPILPLPEDVVAQIKSSTAIVSLTGAVLELLKNALDARASKVEATVDFARGGCLVEDNGLGISPSEFREEGGLGKLYCTSKYYSEEECLGRNGTFLASLGAMSLLTIASRHHEHRSHNLLTLHHSKVIDRQLPATSQHEIHGKHGTRITVRNLFGNLPVRVKQRGVATEQKAEYDRLWEGLKREITGLMLSWREPVSLRVRDADGKMAISLSAAAHNGHETRTRSAGLHAILSLLTQAGYISHDAWSSWVPVSASTSTVSIKGAISLDPAPNKRVQFVSLGLGPLSTESGHNELYDEIDRIFALSSFGSVEDDADVDDNEKLRGQGDNRFKIDGYTNRQLKARKGVDRYPMFHLRLSLEQHGSGKYSRPENLFTGNEASLSSVLEVLKAMITEWLAAHHFRPRKPRVRRPISATSPLITISDDTTTSNQSILSHRHDPNSRIAPTSPAVQSADAHNRKRKRTTPKLNEQKSDRKHHLVFSDWSRIKSGNASFLDALGRKRNSRPMTEGMDRPASTIQTPPVPLKTTLGVPPVHVGSLDDGIRSDHQPAEVEMLEDRYGEAVPWTDPTTKQTYLLNARTGCVLPRPPSRPHTDPSLGIRGSTLGNFKKSLRLPPQKTALSNDSGTWLHGLLGTWDNPIYKPAETSIQQALPHEDQHGHELKYSSHFPKQNDGRFNAFSAASASKLSRAALENAVVIAQLDRKFIFIKMKNCKEAGAGPWEGSDLLVLIDQHAADERIRLEALLADLCKPILISTGLYRSNLGHHSLVAFTVLEQPIQFTLSAQDQRQFERHAARFAAWGVLFDITVPEALIGRPQSVLAVTALPPAISERCKADSQVLIQFLRTAVWKYAEAPSLPPVPDETDFGGDSAAWVRRIASCPYGLIDFVNSRACRSAIMFNDELSLEDCRELVRNLCKCVFPFMCAHGRPSMVPLVDLGTVGAPEHISGPGIEPTRTAETEGSFVAAWKRSQKK
ncbi:DNA mismatch repair protein [Bimuria novae-zelandiae CBS 107.79]|uniref:DNA mismatch repair protein n=1 Tax=Bimuria novae-zelandiae CBS 107.79 TaxID=1447943 RepID=A0A6A5V7K6_9PLEO|nr:DNA mismatch repair protein [Bimuria novae-zelandiae CBS 107.79]